MSNPFSPLILPTEDNRGLQSSLLTVIDALNVVTSRLGTVEDILAAAGLATRRIGAIPMTWLGVWTASFVYLHGDVVTRNLLLMIANKTTTETPTLSANDWDLVCICAPIPTGGSLAVTEVIDTLAAVGEVLVQGDLAVTEIVDILAAESLGTPQPSFGNVTYLANHAGALNLSTAITDLATGGAANPHVLVYENGAQNLTAQSQFGSGSSIFFDGSNDVVRRATDHDDFHNTSAGPTDDTGEFCWEMGFMQPTALSQGYVFTRYRTNFDNRSFFCQTQASGILSFLASTDGKSVFPITIQSAAGKIVADVWAHIAITRENGIGDPGAEDAVRMFINGELVAEQFVATALGFYVPDEIPMAWGNSHNLSGDFTGYIDNIRITIGEPVYTADFTPPTERHPTS